MADQEKIKPYDHPAGGWGSLITGVRHVARQDAVAQTVKSLLRVNQPDGFDCPGCAWPEPKQGHTFEFCENGIKAVAWEATGKRVTPEFFQKHAVSELATWSDHDLEKQGRLTHPMRYNRDADRYEPLTWEQAFALVGKHLNALNHPDEAIFYTSGRTSNEAAFLYQLLARRLGTNNMPDCSNMCHESSGAALSESIGIGKGTVTLEDFELADAIFVIGQNPGTNHPRMLAELEKAAKRGCKIVALNPLRERGLERFLHPQHPVDMMLASGSAIASHYFQPLIGGDLAAITGVIKLVLEHPDKLDRAFIDEHTSGFDAFVQQVNAADWSMIESESGLTRADLQQIADIYLQSERVIICWAMGLTQHKHAVPTIQALVNLLLLRGNIGRPGAGACPVRGHSNVQGDRTVGITERPSRSFLDKLDETFGIQSPRGHGLDVVGAIQAMAAGKARVFLAMGGNFVSATPDTAYTIDALRKCDLTAHVSTKLNRSHTVVGREALILPCLGRSEIDMQAAGPQQVTVEDSMSMVHASSGKNAPASPHLLSEPAIVAGIGNATFGESQPRIAWSDLIVDYSRIREKIEQTIPLLFQGYNDRIRQPGGFHLRNSAREREWRTATGKARFMAAPLPTLALPPGQLRMMTIRSHDQFNTTVYDLNDRYRGIHGTRMVVMMNGRDIRALNLKDGDRVDLIAEWNDGRRRQASDFRVVEYDIPAGCCATYFPETNVLVAHDQYAHTSRTPVSKFVPVRVVPAGSDAPNSICQTFSA